MTATLNPLYRFDTLVVGAANRLAFTAAKAVAESPGTVYNPLFVYARPGLGKTHLLMGIGHAARAINPRLSVEYLTLDEFVESFHAAIAAGQGEAYRRRFIDVDLLAGGRRAVPDAPPGDAVRAPATHRRTPVGQSADRSHQRPAPR